MRTSKRSARIVAFTALLGLAVVAMPGAASAYDVAGDFSLGSNPNGAWSYGWSTTIGSAFNLDPTNTTSAYGQNGLLAWFDVPEDFGSESVVYNSTASPLFIGGHTTFQPGQLALNPGLTGHDAIARWTAPSSGVFNVAATFSGLSTIGDTADVHVLKNGTSIFDSAVNCTPSPTSYSGTLNLTLGDTIDFIAGFGNNGNNHDDTTVLSATVVAVPEPGTLGLVAMSLGCLLSVRFLKRK